MKRSINLIMANNPDNKGTIVELRERIATLESLLSEGLHAGYFSKVARPGWVAEVRIAIELVPGKPTIPRRSGAKPGVHKAHF